MRVKAGVATITEPVVDRKRLIQPTLHDALRSATAVVHERLHAHPGLAAVQAGTINLSAYTALLSRLYGFHQPFELIAALGHHRSTWLENDLAILDVDADKRAALPCCAAFPETTSQEYILGARYVVEGSALGSRGLARQLDNLLGVGVVAGRHFFSGYGTDTGRVWRDYLMQLEAVPDVGIKWAAVVEGSTETFAIFEQWLENWDDGDG